jgi:hypothetical protein
MINSSLRSIYKPLTVINKLQSSLRSDFPGQATLQIDLSRSDAPHSYKAGGTALITLGDIVGRLEPKGKSGDPLGRWSIMHVRRQHQKPITIISIYQVCTSPTNNIGNTAWHQQRLALDGQGRTTTHPRKAFIDDFTKVIQGF